MYLLNNSFIEGQCSNVTLQEAKEQSKELDIKITQEHVDIGNKISGINGFRDFVQLMDSTSW